MSFSCYLYAIVYYPFVNRMYSYVTIMSFLCRYYLLVCNGMSFVWTYMSFLCHSYVFVCNGMSLVIARMSSVCHSYVLVCHPHVTCMYSYVIHMSLVCGFTMNPYEASILRTFGLLKGHSDSWNNILESKSDIPWKYIEFFSNALNPIIQCSSASPSVSETCN